MTEVQARPGANAYGYFDEAALEYVITRPDTPTPWLNYIGEGRYGGIVRTPAAATRSTAIRAIDV